MISLTSLPSLFALTLSVAWCRPSGGSRGSPGELTRRKVEMIYLGNLPGLLWYIIYTIYILRIIF